MCHPMLMARHKKPLHLALDPKLIEELRAWIDAQDARPSMTAVLEAALREWLDARKVKRKS